MVYRLDLAYCGTAYAGWQRQLNAATVQQVIEEALADLLQQPVRLTGASRTDAGVHARRQVAHFQFGEVFPLSGLVHGTNHRLPQDIRILAAKRMPGGFHARRAALGKEYRYRIYRGRVVPPLEAPLLAGWPSTLSIKSMRQALHFLPGRHDFSAFALTGGSHRQPFRRLFAATLEEQGRELCFRFLGDGFLRGMVRRLVGTLLEVGANRRAPESLRELLTGGGGSAGPTAPACGLTLEQVFYPPQWTPCASYEP